MPENAADATLTQELQLGKRFRNEESGYTSGEWLFREPDWLKFIDEHNHAAMWLQASPGRGKTVLAASIIEELEANVVEEKSQLLYYYCRRNPAPTSSTEVIKSLLSQCLEIADEEIISLLQVMVSVHKNRQGIDSKLEESLWNMLQAVVESRPQKTYIIIDGIDEMRSNAGLLPRMLRLLSTRRKRHRVGLLLSSRFDCDISDTVQKLRDVDFSQVNITSERIRQDLIEFITFTINSPKSSLRRKSQQLRDEIVARVCEQAQGSFLYTSLVLDELYGEKVATPAAITTTLNSLPAGLFDAYRQHLGAPEQSSFGGEAFRWIFCAIRPMFWSELRSALAIIDGVISQDHLIDDDCDGFLQNYCGDLVEASGETRDRLNFIHDTVKDFLRQDDPDRGLQILDTDAFVADKLLAFLCGDNLPNFYPDRSFEENRELILQLVDQPEYALYPYAVWHWFAHVGKSGVSQATEVAERLCGFLTSEKCVRWLKGALFLTPWAGRSIDSTSLSTDVVNSLQAWVRTVSGHVAESFISLVKTWVEQFLAVMQDWGRVLERNPFWIHFIPKELLGPNSQFTHTLALYDDQRMFQFHSSIIRTSRTDPQVWQKQCFIVDPERDLAYTWDADKTTISCYHTDTRLSAAEVKLDLGDEDYEGLNLVRGALSPNGRFLAVLLQGRGQKTDVYLNFRTGLQLTFSRKADGLAWVLQNESCIEEYHAIPFLEGILDTRFLVCVLELDHNGLTRTDLFGRPAWSSAHLCRFYRQSLKWEVDDTSILLFSSNSGQLATPGGIISLKTGKTDVVFPFEMDWKYSSERISPDFAFLTYIKDSKTVSHVFSHAFPVRHVLSKWNSLLSDESQVAMHLCSGRCHETNEFRSN